MANVLKMAKIQSIQQLHASGWSQRRIARALAIDRGTVARHLQPSPPDPKPAITPAGSDGSNAATFSPLPAPPPQRTDGSDGTDCAVGPNAAIPPAGLPEGNTAPPTATPRFPRGRPSRCEPLRELILAKLDQQLSAQRIWQDLREDPGFTGGYDSVKRSCAVSAPRRHEFLLRADSRPIQLSANRRRRRSRRLSTADLMPATPVWLEVDAYGYVDLYGFSQTVGGLNSAGRRRRQPHRRRRSVHRRGRRQPRSGRH